MHHKYRDMAQIVLIGLMLLALTGQAHAQAAVKIQGDPINATPPAQTAPSNTTNAVAAKAPTARATGSASVVTNAPKGSVEVDFEELTSFEFETPATIATNLTVGVQDANKQIPAPIMKLDGKLVSITGFPMTLAVEKGRITELLILKNQAMCCFGTTPKITEWVTVKLGGDGVETVLMDQLVTVKGTLHVGAMTEGHSIVDLYRMDGAKMVDY